MVTFKASTTELLHSLQADISANRLVLPMPPDLALRARSLIADPDCSINTLADLISTDATLSARLLKVVNSTAYSGREPIHTISGAITRLGLQLVQSLINQLSLLQSIYQYDTQTRRWLREPVRQSQAVGVWAAALAVQQTKLNPEEAMLSGLIHNIGALPVLARLARRHGTRTSADEAIAIARTLHQKVGIHILQQWHFPPHMLQIIEHQRNPAYGPGQATHYTDLVIAALALFEVEEERLNADQAERLLAFSKLGITPQQALDCAELAESRQAYAERF